MPTLADVLRQTGYAQDGTLATPTPTESPMTKVLAEHIKGLPQKFEQNQAEQMALLGKAFPGNTIESMMTQGDPKAMAELAMQVPFNAMIAYHGTPHNILGKFDISKVGTGEGAQAYGHGMYFAENPAVATEYAEQVKDLPKLGKIWNQVEWAKKQLNKAIEAGNTEEALKFRDLKDKLHGWHAANNMMSKGNVYKVDIPDEYIPNMLDWDKPLSKQSKVVQDALAKIDKDLYHPSGSDYDSEELGQMIYSRLKAINAAKGSVEADKAASEMLNNMGIKGIRYLDAGSRGKSGTSNFVVFDPSEVKILEKNSKPVSRKELLEQQVNKLKD